MHVTVRTGDGKAEIAAYRAHVIPWQLAVLLMALVGLFVSLWPLGLAGDYMNHLARNHIEARIWFDASLRENYTISFAVIPDLAMDIVVPWLAQLTGVYAAGAVMMGAAFVLPPFAGLLIAQTLHGRVSWIALLGFLAVFNENMQWGFVNFVVSTGLALVGFAFWIRCSPSWRRSFIFLPFGVFLAFSHALGFLLFGYLILLWEIGCFAAGQRGSLACFLRQLTTKDAVAMLPGLAVLAMATQGAQELTHAGVVDFSLLPKIDALWAGANFFDPWLARLVTLSLICVFWLGLRRGILEIEPRMKWVCAGLLALILAMPTSVFGIWGLHFRYPAVLIILAAASVKVRPGGGRIAKQAAAGAASLLAVVAYINGALHMARIDGFADSYRNLLTGLPEGARVLPARHEQTDPLLTLHAAGMAVIESSAFVPNLFTNTSPVSVRPQMRALHMPQAWPLLEEELADAAGLELPPSRNGYWSPYYHYGWPRFWDYVLYFRVGPHQSLDLPFLCREAESARAILYRISDSECPAGRPGLTAS